MIRLFAGIAGIALLSACVDGYGGYSGRNVSDLELALGAPNTIQTLSDGRRTYEWSLLRSTPLPFGPFGQDQPGVPSTLPTTENCVLSVTAMPVEGGWVVAETPQSTFVCQ